jgi:hypothetical protein
MWSISIKAPTKKAKTLPHKPTTRKIIAATKEER